MDKLRIAFSFIKIKLKNIGSVLITAATGYVLGSAAIIQVSSVVVDNVSLQSFGISKEIFMQYLFVALLTLFPIFIIFAYVFKRKSIDNEILSNLNSNVGSLDFQNTKNEDGKQLFEKVLETSQTWGTDKNIMYVVGANRSEQLSEVRDIIPNHFLLVPGVGAQGGSLEEAAKYGMNDECGLLVNSSRGIIYASTEIDFAEKARQEAQKLQFKMDILLSEKGI